MSLLWTLVGCASWFGLVELQELPEGFPLELTAPTGKITRTEDQRHVAVDQVFESEAEARAAFEALQKQAAAQGYAGGALERRDKRDVADLAGPSGRLVMQCCPRRADRQFLVLVSWFSEP